MYDIDSYSDYNSHFTITMDAGEYKINPDDDTEQSKFSSASNALLITYRNEFKHPIIEVINKFDERIIRPKIIKYGNGNKFKIQTILNEVPPSESHETYTVDETEINNQKNIKIKKGESYIELNLTDVNTLGTPLGKLVTTETHEGLWILLNQDESPKYNIMYFHGTHQYYFKPEEGR